MEPAEKKNVCQLPPEMWLKILEKGSFADLLRWRQSCHIFKLLADEILVKRSIKWMPTFPTQNGDDPDNYVLLPPEVATQQFGTVIKSQDDIKDFMFAMGSCSGNAFPNRTLISTPEMLKIRFKREECDWIGYYEKFRRMTAAFGDEILSYVTEVNPSLSYFVNQMEPIFQMKYLQKLTLFSGHTQRHVQHQNIFKQHQGFPHLDNLKEVNYYGGNGLFLHQKLFFPEYCHQISQIYIQNLLYPVYIEREDTVTVPPSELIPAVTKLKICYPSLSQVNWLRQSSASIREISFKCRNIQGISEGTELGFKSLVEALDQHSGTLQLICLDFGWDPASCEANFQDFRLLQPVMYHRVKRLQISHEFILHWPSIFEQFVRKLPNLEKLYIINYIGVEAISENKNEAEAALRKVVDKLRLWLILPRSTRIISFPQCSIDVFR